MTIEERASGSVIVLDVSGRMTIEAEGNAPLTAVVRRLLQEGRRKIVLNLAGVPYIDTSGLCNIIQAYITTIKQGGGLKLLHLTPRVQRVLAVTRLLTILDTYESEADAVASFGAAGS